MFSHLQDIKMNHTPGPWVMMHDPSPSYPTDYIVAPASDPEVIVAECSSREDAALIAAAPELLTALVDMLYAVDDHTVAVDDHTVGAMFMAVENANALLERLK